MTTTKGGPGSLVTSATRSWSWGLYADWCASWGRSPLPSSRERLLEFLEVFPASRSTHVKRLALILAAHTEAGLTLDAPRVTRLPDSLWVPRPGRLDPAGALMQLPRYRYPVGLVGRRDGFLIVLTGILGLSRAQARRVSSEDITINPEAVTVRGLDVVRASTPGECPRCAVAGWLKVIAPHYERLRGSYLPLLDPTTAQPDIHICEKDVGALWQNGVALLPSIDRTGAVATGGPLSTRAITSIIGRRRIPAEEVVRTGPAAPASGRYRDATSGELAAAQDAVMDDLDYANNYLEELLADAATLKAALGRRM